MEDSIRIKDVNAVSYTHLDVYKRQVLILTNAATFFGTTFLSKYISLKRKDTVVLSKSDYEELKEFNNLFLAKELIEKK